MKVDLAAIVLGWDKLLVTADHLVAKAKEQANGEPAHEREILEWHLAPDMFNLRQQVQAVCNLVVEWAARAAGVAMPKTYTGEIDFAELGSAIGESRRFLSTLDASLFLDRDDILLKADLRIIEPTMPIGQWITGFAATNILFHLSMVYAILRSRGVPLGKQDLFAGGL